MQEKSITRSYHCFQLKGDSYSVGKQQSEIIKSVPGLAHFFVNPVIPMSSSDITEEIRLLNEFGPTLVEELQGIADGLETPLQQLVFLSETYLPTGNCSQFITPYGENFYHVRSYEFSPDRDDFRLVNTSIDGCYRHLGFSVMFSGRYEGMNEHGLVITMTASGIPVGPYEGMSKPKNAGLQFWVLVRLVLEQCKNVSEALEIIRDFPLCSNTNFLISDHSGNIALVETCGKKKQIKKFNSLDGVVSTNHYTIEEMKSYLPMAMENSYLRYQRIMEFLTSNKKKTSLNDLKSFLKKTYPEGVACPYYDEFFGTLRSMIFEPKEKWVEICFGLPGINQWYRFCVGDDIEPAAIPAIFVNEQAKPSFWKFVPSS